MGFKTNGEDQTRKAGGTGDKTGRKRFDSNAPLKSRKRQGWVGSETREAHERAFPFKGQSPSFFESERDFVGLPEPCGS